MRGYWITDDLRTLRNTDRWDGLHSIGMVERSCVSDGKESLERRYFINSIATDANRFAQAVRKRRPCARRRPILFGCMIALLQSFGRVTAFMDYI